MNTPLPPSEEELHAYVDGALDPVRRAAVETFLLSDALATERVRRWSLDASRLSLELARDVAAHPAARLDPSRVRRRLSLRSKVRVAAAVILVAAIGAGGVGGWQIQRASAAPAPMADAVEAYRVFAADANRPVEIGADDAAHLQKWLSKRLGRSLRFPDLRSEGFELLGGRLLSTNEGPAALIFYQDSHGERLSFYVRQSSRFPQGTQGTRNDEGLSTHYWYDRGYGYAVVASAADPRVPAVQAALRSAS